MRVDVQGETIHDVDINNSQSSRKHEHNESDDEDQYSQLNVNGHATMNIYRQRQQKCVKLTMESTHINQA